MTKNANIYLPFDFWGNQMWVKPWLEMEIPFGMSKDTLAISGRISGGLWGVTQILLDYIAHVNFHAASNSFSIPRCQKSRRWKTNKKYSVSTSQQKQWRRMCTWEKSWEGGEKEIVVATCQRREADALRSQQKAKQLKVRVRPIYSQRQVLLTGIGFYFSVWQFCSWLEIEFRFLININMRTYRGPIDRQKLI